MQRRRFLATLGTAAAASAGCVGLPDGENPGEDPDGTQPPDGQVRNGSFEDDLAHWQIGKDLPEQLEPEDASATTTTERAGDGDYALRLMLDGSHDDGTVWVQQSVDLTDVSTLAVDAYAPEPSFNLITQMAAYTGPVRDLTEQDFDRSEQVYDHTGWKTYEYPVDQNGTGLVAVGINIVWETTAVRFLDRVRLRSD
jgi:hypothetical protein